MNLDELRDVQNRERSMDSLQELRDTFYADTAEYIGELKAERDRLAREADDPFSAPAVSRLTDEIETAEQVAASIYERRVGKVVKQASFAAADMPGAESGLTTEEQDLYDDIVDRIRENKRRVMDALDESESESVFAGDGHAGHGPDSDGEPTEGTDTAGNVDAADLMGGDDAVADEETTEAGAADDALTGTDNADSPLEETADDERPTADDERPTADDETDEAADTAGAAADEHPAGDDPERERIRVTTDVGEIFGVDERVYTLEADDVIELPTENAAPLLERDAAERLE